VTLQSQLPVSASDTDHLILDWGVIASGPSITTPERIRIADAPVDPFTANRWRMEALGSPRHMTSPSITFSTRDIQPPPTYAGSLRRAAYVLVNEATPANLLERSGAAAVRWLGPEAIVETFRYWRHTAAWLAARGIHQFADADPDTMDEFRRAITRLPISQPVQQRRLHVLSRLQGYGPLLPQEDRLPDLPWTPGDLGALLRKSRGDNTTEVIEAERMGPLLTWALAWVGDFSEDIFAARDTADRYRRAGTTSVTGNSSMAGTAGRQAARTWLETLPAGTVLPGFKRGSITGYSRKYLIGLHNLECSSLDLGRELWKREDLSFDTDMPHPMNLAVTGSIADRPWIERLDFRDFDGTEYLVTHLRTACIIVVAYLSGMRPYEALTLRPNCHEQVLLSSGAVQHLIHGQRRKGLRDDDDMTDLDGVPHTWVTIEQAAKAIKLSRRINPDGQWLWQSAANRRRRDQVFADAEPGPLNPMIVKLKIERFIAFCNQLRAANDLPLAYEIPDGTPITLRMFRRTLAFHIDRQPDGEIALGVQYGHLDLAKNLVDTRTGSSYAGTQKAGRSAQLRRDQAESHRQILLEVQNEVQAGGGISGPAAARVLAAANKAGATFKGAVLSVRETSALLTDPDLLVYDNPFAFSLCVFDRLTAACQRGDGLDLTDAAPVLPDCVTSCVNRAVVDSGAEQMQDEAERLLAFAETQPTPLAHRLRGQGDALRQQVHAHHETRQLPGGQNPPAEQGADRE
jgi:hypothetical protein